MTPQNYNTADRTSAAYDAHGRWIPPSDAWISDVIVDTGEGWRMLEDHELEGAVELHDPNQIGKSTYYTTNEDGSPKYIGQRFTWDELFEDKDGNYVGNFDKKGDHRDFVGRMLAENEAGERFLDDIFPQIGDDTGMNYEQLKYSTVPALGQMFNTSQWNMLSQDVPSASRLVEQGDHRLGILYHYQQDYHGDSWYNEAEELQVLPGFSDELKDDINWGLDIQRAWLAHSTYKKGMKGKNSREIYEQLMGLTSKGENLTPWFNHGSTTDFSFYNSAAGHKVLDSMRQHMFGDDYRQDYWNVEQYRDAYQMYRDIDHEDRQKALAWSAKYMEPYKIHQEQAADHVAWTFHPSRRFDPETNTTNFYDPLVGHAQVDIDGNPITKTIESIAEPQELLIRTGTDQPETDADGNRIINTSAIEELYHTYLGRNPDQGGLDYWLNGNQGTFTDIKYNIENSAEALNYSGNRDKYLNPQAYGSTESIKAKQASTPSTVTPPTITIRNIGQPKKPTQSYMSLPAQWLTEAPQKIAGSVPGDTE